MNSVVVTVINLFTCLFCFTGSLLEDSQPVSMPPKKQTKKVIPTQAVLELPPSDNESEATARGEGRDHFDEEVMGLLF